MPLSIADTDSRMAPSSAAIGVSAEPTRTTLDDSAGAGQSARAVDDIVARVERLASPVLLRPDLATGALLLCPHCAAPVHVQLSPCDVSFPVTSAVPTGESDR